MLTETPLGTFKAACDRCGAVLGFDAKDADAARAELGKLGWMEAAVKGRGRAKWSWWCPACAPKGSTSMGRSTI